MAKVEYRAKVREGRLLELPPEAETLALQPGEEITVSLEPTGATNTPVCPPNEKGLAIMREIAEMQREMPPSDGLHSLKLLQEARGGAMYGYELTE